MNERIRNKINVSNIIAIDYDEFEKFCIKDNLQTFVFQYDNVNAKITVMTIISDEKNKKIISFKYQNYTNVFDKIDVNKLSKHKSYRMQSKRRIKYFYSNLFTICLLLSLKF